MADDPIAAGLRRTQVELEELAARLSPPEAAANPESSTPNAFDSDAAREAGSLIADVLGEGLRSFVFAEKRPTRSRFTTPTPRAAPAVTTPIPTAAVPVAIPVESRPPEQTTSNEVHVDVEGPNFVGHVEDIPRRLDLENDVRHQIRRRKLSGPVIGASEDQAATGDYPHSGT